MPQSCGCCQHLGEKVGDLGDERQSHRMKFHKAESKVVPFGRNPESLSWKLILENGAREVDWGAPM